MSQELQSVEALIDGVKGTTGFFSNLFSKKYGLTFVFIIAGVILSKIFLG
jgi:hypothetical protein